MELDVSVRVDSTWLVQHSSSHILGLIVISTSIERSDRDVKITLFERVVSCGDWNTIRLLYHYMRVRLIFAYFMFSYVRILF